MRHCLRKKIVGTTGREHVADCCTDHTHSLESSGVAVEFARRMLQMTVGHERSCDIAGKHQNDEREVEYPAPPYP